MTSTNPALAAALEASGDPRRYVITGGPSSGKDDLIEAVHAAGIPCMVDEPGREIYRKHRERLGRHLRKEDRREYSLEVLEAFITEYTAHTNGIRFYNRGIPDGYGWEGFFGLKPTPQLEEATDAIATTRSSCSIRWTPLRTPTTSFGPRTARFAASTS